MALTTEADVLAILEILESVGADPIIGGGWGIDALIGEQGREHADLDVAIDGASEAAAVAALEAAGYSITSDWRPVRLALTHRDGAEVDLHPVVVGADGVRVQQGLADATYEYPPADIIDGTIGGRPVRCLSAALQMRFHDGYEPTPVDVADCARLSKATGVPVPHSMAGHVNRVS